MATTVIMPKQGQSVESCIITKWHKKVGDRVEKGDILFSYETDKASFEEESHVSGTILAILFQEDDDVPCLQNVCVIGEAGESVDEFSTVDRAETVSQAENEVLAPTQAQTTVTPLEQQTTTKVSNSDKVSPRARNLAEKLGIDTNAAEATGPNGRVIEIDIHRLREQGIFATSAAISSGSSLPQNGTGIGGRTTVTDLNRAPEAASTGNAASTQAAPTGLGYRVEKVPNIRKVIAKSMQHSLQSMSQLTLNSSFDASELLEIRKKLKAANVDFNVTLNDMILFAVARVLKDHPMLNANFINGDTMRYFDNVNLGMAVDTDKGLVVPTIFTADTMSLVQLSNTAKDLADKCKKGTISPDMIKGGSFTITNLGTLGIESFTPVINPPQTGILGVNSIVTRVREVNGTIETYPAMGLSLTFDHGALDGAPAARFLKALGTALENFSILLMK